MPQLHQLKNGREGREHDKGPTSGRIEHYKITHVIHSKCQSTDPWLSLKCFHGSIKEWEKYSAICDGLRCCAQCIQLCGTPGTVSHQDPLSVGFPRQEHWEGCHSLLHVSCRRPHWQVLYHCAYGCPGQKSLCWSSNPYVGRDLSQKWSPCGCNQVKMMS